MRISTAQIYSTNVANINRQQSDLLHLQQQIANNKRVLTPSDDPVAAARSVVVEQSSSINTMQMRSQGVASDALKGLDSKLTSIEDVLTYIRTQSNAAINGSLPASEKASMASDIEAQFYSLLSLANSRDSNDEFMFSGYKGDTQPFSGGLSPDPNIPAVTYDGDQGSRCVQVSSSRQIPVNVNGQDLFMTVADGAGGNRDVFTVVSDFVRVLKDTTLTDAGFTSAISAVTGRLDNAIDNILSLHAQTGSRMNEVDNLASVAEDLKVQYVATNERLVGLDYASAISDFQQQKTYLEAAMNSFTQVSGLSLFKYIS